MVKITYEINKKMNKIYQGETHVSWTWNGQIIFEDLTIKDRETLGLPINENTKEIIAIGGNIPVYELDVEMVNCSKAIAEQEVKKYRDMLDCKKPEEHVVTTTDENFVSTLTKDEL